MTSKQSLNEKWLERVKKKAANTVVVIFHAFVIIVRNPFVRHGRLTRQFQADCGPDVDTNSDTNNNGASPVAIRANGDPPEREENARSDVVIAVAGVGRELVVVAAVIVVEPDDRSFQECQILKYRRLSRSRTATAPSP